MQSKNQIEIDTWEVLLPGKEELTGDLLPLDIVPCGVPGGNSGVQIADCFAAVRDRKDRSAEAPDSYPLPDSLQ